MSKRSTPAPPTTAAISTRSARRLYHLATGETPFPGEKHMEIVEKKKQRRFPPCPLAYSGGAGRA